jgi:hypothetical protein
MIKERRQLLNALGDVIIDERAYDITYQSTIKAMRLMWKGHQAGYDGGEFDGKEKGENETGFLLME